MEGFDISTALTDAVSGMGAEFAAVAGIGLGFLAILWGAPKALGFFKRVAK